MGEKHKVFVIQEFDGEEWIDLYDCESIPEAKEILRELRKAEEEENASHEDNT